MNSILEKVFPKITARVILPVLLSSSISRKLFTTRILVINAPTGSEIKNDNCEGVVYTNNNYELLGSFGGKRFDAELDTNKGKVKLRFLITEYMECVFN